MCERLEADYDWALVKDLGHLDYFAAAFAFAGRRLPRGTAADAAAAAGSP